MMGGKKLAVVMVFIFLCALYSAVSAADAQPGSADDPLVTRSYVDKRVGEVMRVLESGSGGVSAALGEDDLMEQIEYAVRQQVQKTQGTTFSPVSVEMGQTIYGGEGTEMILRSGSGHIITSSDAVVNVTTGLDLKHGAAVPKGNLLIFPRDDGRGVRTADSCWFLVKGDYTIK